MAQNKKTSSIIKNFGTVRMCNSPEEIEKWKQSGGRYELCDSVVHSGVIGCGKTTTIAQAFGVWCLYMREHGLTGLRIILAGVSKKRVKENFCNALIKEWGDGAEGYHETHSSKLGYRDAELFGQWIYFVDLKDKSAEERIRGISDVTGIIFEELTLIDKDKYDLIIGRLRSSLTEKQKEVYGDKYLAHWVVASTNPDGPGHWILKAARNDALRIVRWGMQDACYPEAKGLYKKWIKLYKDNPTLYQRNLLGKWVGGTLSVYTGFRPDRHTYGNDEYDIDLKAMKRSFIGVDAGSSHPTAILLISKTWDNVYVISKGMRIEHTAPSDIVRAMGEYYELIRRAGGSPIAYVDPAAAWLKDEMRKVGMEFFNAFNEHMGGINFVRDLLATDEILINRDECPDLVDEMGSYSFKDAEKDDVVKLGDDFVDALRYGVYSDYMCHKQ